MQFSKYHGLGNDFLVVDCRSAPNTLEALRAASTRLCDRRFGVGGDGVLAILPAITQGADARMVVINSDGSEAEMCGNGIRCVAEHLRKTGSGGNAVTIDTGAGLLRCAFIASDSSETQIEVAMGRARFSPESIPLAGAQTEWIGQNLESQGRTAASTAVSMGNPHCVQFVEARGAELRTLAERFGPALEKHPLFPRHTNVEFARIVERNHIELVVWERGCGITLACGTGACATAAAGVRLGLCDPDRSIRVDLLGGSLAITALGPQLDMVMRGPAVHVYDGVLAAAVR